MSNSIDTVIVDTLTAANVKRYVTYIQECFAADLAIRDQAYRKLERDLQAVTERLAALESARAVPLPETPLADDQPTDAQPGGPHTAARRDP